MPAVVGQQTGDESLPPSQHSIFFGGGSAYVVAKERSRLQTFLNSVPDIKNYGIELQGHTDDIGDRDYNLRLSQARTLSVQRLLLAFPVDQGAIELLPLGEESPTFDNNTWQGKLSNRRVDVILRPLL